MPGVPDVHVMTEDGQFHWLELKIGGFNNVELSPHQCAWLSRHQKGNAWVLVYHDKTPSTDRARIYAYHAREAVDLRLYGLRHRCTRLFEEPFDWEEIFGLIAPTGAHKVADAEAQTDGG